MRSANQVASVVANVLLAVEGEAPPHVRGVTSRLSLTQLERAGGVTAVGRTGIESDPDIYRARFWYGFGMFGYVRP